MNVFCTYVLKSFLIYEISIKILIVKTREKKWYSKEN